MTAISIPPALRKLCGLPARLPAEELVRRLPAIIQSVGQAVEQGRVELVKSASLVRAIVSHTPNPGIERAEQLPVVGSGDGADPNRCLESVFPWS